MEATSMASPRWRRPNTSFRKKVCEMAGYLLNRYPTRSEPGGAAVWDVGRESGNLNSV